MCQNVKNRNIDIVLLLPFSNTFQYIQDVKDPVKDDKLIETFWQEMTEPPIIRHRLQNNESIQFSCHKKYLS